MTVLIYESYNMYHDNVCYLIFTLFASCMIMHAQLDAVNKARAKPNKTYKVHAMRYHRKDSCTNNITQEHLQCHALSSLLEASSRGTPENATEVVTLFPMLSVFRGNLMP